MRRKAPGTVLAASSQRRPRSRAVAALALALALAQAVSGQGPPLSRLGADAAVAAVVVGRLQANTNHSAKPKRLPAQPGFQVDPKELEVYSADEYLTGDAETDDLYIRLASLYNTFGDKRVVMQEKKALGKASRADDLNYKKEKAELMRKINALQQALKNRDAKPYLLPKILLSALPVAHHFE